MSGRNDSPDHVRAGGRLLGVGISGTRLTDGERGILRDVAPGAIVLFSRNVESPEQLDELVASIREASDPAPVLMIDQEGGRVDRLRSLVPGVPAAADLDGCEDPTLAAELGRVIGLLLARFDIEVNLAPVVDLWRDGLSPSLVRRCFGSDPNAVSERAGSFIAGMAGQGVLSCLKHFPGLGVAATDPHHATSVVDLSMAELETADLGPYRALAAGVPAVMVGHGVYPRIDDAGLPGTLSRFISTELLRDRIGFEGLAVTDDMEMHAVSDLASCGEIAARSLMAGNDLILFCSRIDEARSIALALGRLTDSERGAARLAEATLRVESFVRQCGAWADRREKARMSLEHVREQVASLAGKLASRST